MHIGWNKETHLTINAATAVAECALDAKQLGRFVVQVLGGFLLALDRAGLPSGAVGVKH